MRRLIALWMLWASSLAFADTAAELANRLSDAGLDPDACYRVREITLVREDIRLFFTEGYLIFGQPVDGRRHTAVFSGQVEGGDGEVLIMPPTRVERLSLATFTESPNLNEHFQFVMMIFSDDTAEELMETVQEKQLVRESPERGMLLSDNWSRTVKNMTLSFGPRLVYDRLTDRPPAEGFFYAAVRGARHGNFDIVYDPTSPEQVQVGQVRFRDERAFFDVWTSFRSRAFRNGTRETPQVGYQLTDYRIDATLDRQLKLSATTRATLNVGEQPRRAMFFDISPRMSVSDVLIDGQPCEIWQREALRANLFGRGSGLFLVLAPEPLAPGAHSIEFRHEGTVVRDAGNGVYFVGARNSWYPFHGLAFVDFDVTFRYPPEIDLVFTGEIIKDRTEEGVRITRRKPKNPVRLLGFNIGNYEHVTVERENFAVEVYANTGVEDALAPKQRIVLVPSRSTMDHRRRRQAPLEELVPIPAATEQPDPTARLEELADEVARAFEFMLEHFGPAPAERLMVSPIPGTFGQGFPGLLYLSTMSYLAPEERPEAARNIYSELFYSETLHAHETAHQWWGNIVSAKTYQDVWLMEALANYSALMLLEQRRGSEALSTLLDQYLQHLLVEGDDGEPLDSAGPIVWGARLDSSRAEAYRIITYEKGSWILHMLRRRMGDDRFLEMLGDLCQRYRYETLSTAEFREHAARYLPGDLPDRELVNFFDQWVFDTGIPILDVSQRIRGKEPQVRVTVTIKQSGVPEYFSALIPVELRFADGTKIVRWLETAEEPVTLDVTVPQRPVEVVCNPGDSTLAVIE